MDLQEEGRKRFAHLEAFVDPKRVWILCLVFLAAAVWVQSVGYGRTIPLRRPLSDFPKTLGPWRGGPDERLSENIVRVLGVDDYVSRTYFGPGESVHFYASYFATTGGGKGYHSPRNCMPGSGWDVAELEVVPLEFPEGKGRRTVKVSRMLMQKGSEKQVVLYWYQGRGRIMPTEYSERIYRVLDSLIRRRTEGAFVRIIVPVSDGRIAEARKVAVAFARQVIPRISRFLPD